ncbi:hypothetical protein JOD27_004826 [Lentzea nigeriaca]|nr:hypothetical protein [Lentzea nigeriaca]
MVTTPTRTNPSDNSSKKYRHGDLMRPLPNETKVRRTLRVHRAPHFNGGLFITCVQCPLKHSGWGCNSHYSRGWIDGHGFSAAYTSTIAVHRLDFDGDRPPLEEADTSEGASERYPPRSNRGRAMSPAPAKSSLDTFKETKRTLDSHADTSMTKEVVTSSLRAILSHRTCTTAPGGTSANFGDLAACRNIAERPQRAVRPREKALQTRRQGEP